MAAFFATPGYNRRIEQPSSKVVENAQYTSGLARFPKTGYNPFGENRPVGKEALMDTKQRLLEMGLELLLKQGYNRTGIQEVLGAVGVPKGSFYHYFKSKEDFGVQVIEHYASKSLLEMEACLGQPAAPLERLKNFFTMGREQLKADNFSGGCLIGKLTQEMGDLNRAFERCLEKKYRAIRERLAVCLAEAQNEGQIGQMASAEDLADFLLNSWQGAIMRTKVAKSEAPLKQFDHMVFEELLAPAPV